MQELAAWHIWVVIGLVLAGLELLGAHFVLLGLGISALVGGVLAAVLGAGLTGQLIGVTIAALGIVPLFVRKIYPAMLPKERFGTLGSGAEKGQMAEVIARADGRLAVRLSGDEYPLRCEGEQPVVGETVRIMGVEGITVQVERLSSAS